jgi:hypothetical protein
MLPRKSSLVRSVEELRKVLDERDGDRGKDWPRRAEQCLERIEQSARRHRARLENADGRVVDLDTPLNPSPTVARRTDELRQDLGDLLREARTLRERARTLHPVAANTDPGTVAGVLPVAPEAADIADFAVFCERVERLLEGFEHVDEEETDLIQESITLDLGAGD